MNYEFLKQKMDKFFRETTAEELMSELELLGYEFVDSSVEYVSPDLYGDITMLCHNRKPTVWQTLLNRVSQKDKKQSLNKFEAFLCKLAA